MIQKGDMVKERYGFDGIVTEIYNDWEDLKDKNRFVTIDSDQESNKMNNIEKLIEGDPKDKWLKMQNKPFSNEQLEERWFSVSMFFGGSSWTSESGLRLINSNIN